MNKSLFTNLFAALSSLTANINGETTRKNFNPEPLIQDKHPTVPDAILNSHPVLQTQEPGSTLVSFFSSLKDLHPASHGRLLEQESNLWGPSSGSMLARLNIPEILGLKEEGKSIELEFPTLDDNLAKTRKTRAKIQKYEKRTHTQKNEGRKLRGAPEELTEEDYDVVTFDTDEDSGAKTSGYLVVTKEGLASGIIRTRLIDGVSYTNETIIMIRPNDEQEGEVILTNIHPSDKPKIPEEAEDRHPSILDVMGEAPERRGLAKAKNNKPATWSYPSPPAKPLEFKISYVYPKDLVDALAGQAKDARRQQIMRLDAAAIFESVMVVIKNSGLEPYVKFELGDVLEIDRPQTRDSYQDLLDISLLNTKDNQFMAYIASTGAYCGRGFLPGSIKGLSAGTIRRMMSNVVDRHCAIINYSAAHELGHNLNGDHNKEVAFIREQFPYSYAYLKTYYDSRGFPTWEQDGTVLAYTYDNSKRIPTFSGPGKFGDKTIGSENENNRRAILGYLAEYAQSTDESSTPTKKSTPAPTKKPTKIPTRKPTKRPTKAPTAAKPTNFPTKAPTIKIDPINIQHVVYAPPSFNAPLDIEFSYRSQANGPISKRKVKISNGKLTILNATDRPVQEENYIVNQAVLNKIKLVAGKKVLIDIDDRGTDIKLSYVPYKYKGKGKKRKLIKQKAQVFLTLKNMPDLGNKATISSTVVNFPGMDNQIDVTAQIKMPQTTKKPKGRLLEENKLFEIQEKKLEEILGAGFEETEKFKVSINALPDNMLNEMANSVPALLRIIHMAENNQELKNEMRDAGFLDTLFKEIGKNEDGDKYDTDDEVIKALFSVLSSEAIQEYSQYLEEDDKILILNFLESEAKRNNLM